MAIQDRQHQRTSSNTWPLFERPRIVGLRRWFLGGAILICLITLHTFMYRSQGGYRTILPPSPEVDSDQPPTYKRLRQWEKDLPQHDLDLPFPEGRTGRYVLFKNQVQMLGWNNQLNEVLLNTWLAYKSKRAYVFQDYIWKQEYYPWPVNQARDGIPHTPANALLAGPSVGGSWDPGDNAPRSVSEQWFDTVCPKSERRIIGVGEVKPAIQSEKGDVIFNHWEKLLLEAPERCIEIQAVDRSKDNFPQVFDLFLWGSDRILPLWDSFRDSPVSRLLATSPIVQSAVDRNNYLFLPRGLRSQALVSNNPYDRMLAIHLRRGDYRDACYELAKWNSTFYSWNLLPSLPDKFNNPPGSKWGQNTPENVATYLERCYPTDEYLLSKIRKSREDYISAGKSWERKTLDVLYMLTNDKSDWVERLKRTLRKEGWHTIVSTADLELDQEQKDVGMAVDMDIARKAAVFIGNGWSSMTSNIVHRRLVDGKAPISIRFY